MKKPSPWQIQVYTVSALTSQIRQSINSQFRDVLVQGEISNFKLYPSGHLYFTLKDDNAMIKAVVFNFWDKYSENMIEDGSAVICKGRVDVYEKRGEYRLLVDAIEVQGQGLLQLKFQKLKEKLLKEGLFDAERKKQLPLLPKLIGIVTSPAGAAIRDMLKVIYGKYENMSVLIYPVKVQGDDACYEIAEGINYFNRTKEADVIIVGRGGGSLEDLAPFNEEVVARAIFSSEIPVVSAVGHEVDFTIADFAADVRAPTPTAAADIVVRNKAEFLDAILDMEKKLKKGISNRLERSRFLLYQGSMELKERKRLFTDYRMYLDELLNNMIHGFSLYFRGKKGQVDTLTQRISDLNPDNILRRGYSITIKKDTKEVVVRADQIVRGEELLVKLHKGEADCTVMDKRL
ncbi:MAG: exodeoxyribonuclease VII large subunit [Proteobacteria bacterium]|nr:exodeoxyribonuclease VII large subunit [Pseudomonadota bacterium]